MGRTCAAEGLMGGPREMQRTSSERTIQNGDRWAALSLRSPLGVNASQCPNKLCAAYPPKRSAVSSCVWTFSEKHYTCECATQAVATGRVLFMHAFFQKPASTKHAFPARTAFLGGPTCRGIGRCCRAAAAFPGWRAGGGRWGTTWRPWRAWRPSSAAGR
jgi:hypothetical protein